MTRKNIIISIVVSACIIFGLLLSNGVFSHKNNKPDVPFSAVEEQVTEAVDIALKYVDGTLDQEAAERNLTSIWLRTDTMRIKGSSEWSQEEEQKVQDLCEDLSALSLSVEKGDIDKTQSLCYQIATHLNASLMFE